MLLDLQRRLGGRAEAGEHIVGGGLAGQDAGKPQLLVEIGAGAGAYASTVWRIGLMGRNARPDAVLLVLAALQDVLGRD